MQQNGNSKNNTFKDKTGTTYGGYANVSKSDFYENYQECHPVQDLR